MSTMFVAGEYWTAERKDGALRQMCALRDSEQMQAMMRMIGEAAAEGDPAAAAASAAAATGISAATPKTSAVVRESCVYRRGTQDDGDALAALIVSGELPPFFLEPYIEGFLVIEHAGQLVGCGGLEFYGDDAVVRSVVVDEIARGLGLGLDVARLLEEDARSSGARDVYLFTLHAWKFWKKLGYHDLPLPEWAAPLHENWQYQFVDRFPQAARDVHPMVRRG